MVPKRKRDAEDRKRKARDLESNPEISEDANPPVAVEHSVCSRPVESDKEVDPEFVCSVCHDVMLDPAVGKCAGFGIPIQTHVPHKLSANLTSLNLPNLQHDAVTICAAIAGSPGSNCNAIVQFVGCPSRPRSQKSASASRTSWNDFTPPLSRHAALNLGPTYRR
jgi:hypothetical protein